MVNLELEQQVNDYIKKGDEKFLNMILAMAKEYFKENNSYQLTDEQKLELDRRKAKQTGGESKIYSWEDVKSIARDRSGS